MSDRIYFSEVKNIVDSGDIKAVEKLIVLLTYTDMENVLGKAAAFDYIVKNTKGDLRVEAFFRARWYWNRKLFEDNLALVNSSSERLKIIVNSAYATSYPEVFIEAWETKSRLRFILINSIPDLRRKELLEKIDFRILDSIDLSILSESNEVRAAYAIMSWADSEILHDMKEDKFRGVINSLSMNPYIKNETARFLVSNYKTPSIRVHVAYNTDDLELLKMIWESTKSEEIRKSVKNNPNFKYLEIEG